MKSGKASKTPKKKMKGGKVVDHYDNGQVRFRGSYKEGEMHGAWTFYRRDGSLMRSGSFKLGEQSGTWRTYSRDGEVVKTTEFKPTKKISTGK